MMTHDQATQVARLLNTRNRLPREYTADDILAHAERYILEISGEKVLGCVEVRKVQWYQREVRHLSVDEGHLRKGIGTRLVRRAEDLAIASGGRIAQCTIQVGNVPSEQLFASCGYRVACTFYNRDTGYQIAVWQKVLGGPKQSRKVGQSEYCAGQMVSPESVPEADVGGVIPRPT